MSILRFGDGEKERLGVDSSTRFLSIYNFCSISTAILNIY